MMVNGVDRAYKAKEETATSLTLTVGKKTVRMADGGALPSPTARH